MDLAGKAEAERPLEDRSVRIEFITRTVIVGGRPVRLTKGEMSVLATLAVQPGAVDGQTLSRLLWPQVSTAGKALHVYVHRIRRKSMPSVIELTGAGYRLNPLVQNDVAELERAVDPLVRVQSPSAVQIAEGLALWALCRETVGIQLGTSRPGSEVLNERYVGARGRLGRWLASTNFRAGEHQAALAIARDCLHANPTDESAAELAVRALLMLGDRRGALRIYHGLRRAVRSQLGALPSASIRKLLGD